MALVYRAHFAFIRRPIFTSKGFNTSALYGFTQTLLDIITSQSPTHIAVAFDTEAPTQRHLDYPDYKIQREAMPEDIAQSLPHLRRMIEAFQIPVLSLDGFEADDIIGTLVRRAEKEGFDSWMVTPDKDFAQLVTSKSLLYKPSRMGEGIESWATRHPEQMGHQGPAGHRHSRQQGASDNIQVPGGEKTAETDLRYGSVENL